MIGSLLQDLAPRADATDIDQLPDERRTRWSPLLRAARLLARLDRNFDGLTFENAIGRYQRKPLSGRTPGQAPMATASGGILAPTMPRPHALLVTSLLAATAMAQVDATRLSDLRRAGEAGMRELFDLYADARDRHSPDAIAYARALAAFGSASHVVIDRTLNALATSEEPTTSLLLRTLANGALLATPGQQDAIRRASKQWAADGRLYSPDPDTATYAWYEYVRLMNRLRLADIGTDAEATEIAIDRLRNERNGIVVILARIQQQQQAPQPPDPHGHCAIESFGSHGQREWLEAIAEVALRCPTVSDRLVDELCSYLRHSPPREPRIITEHCAGIGENAPNQLPGAKWPTRWLYDDWHFACARAVLKHGTRAEHLTLARRHLLYERDPFRRRQALTDIRLLPKPWHAFVPDLTANLQVTDRATVREALITLGMADSLPDETLAVARTLADSDDRELQALARRLLR